MKTALDCGKALPGLLLAMVLLFGSGCVPKATGIAPKEMAHIRRVAVVSLLGNELHQLHSGTTLFTDRSTHFPVPSWDIDSFVTGLAAERLRRCRGIEFVALPEHAVTLESIYGSVTNKDSETFSLNHVKEPLTALSTTYGIDAYIIIVRRSVGGIGPMPIHGYCLYGRSLLGKMVSLSVFVCADLRVIDARSFEELGEATINTFGGVDTALWRDDLATLHPVDLARIEKEVKGRLGARVNARLIEVGFSGS